MDEITLTDDQHDALVALPQTQREHAEASGLEHRQELGAVVMPGARHDVGLRLSCDTLRSLGHLGAINSTGERDATGRGRWTFEITAHATDLV